MASSPIGANAARVKSDSTAQGWWRAADGYWYPPQARPGQLWKGEVRGPDGEVPPGPGWWMANDYRWYPPEARPGELWSDPTARTAGVPVRRGRDEVAPARTPVVAAAQNQAALLAALGLLLIIFGIVLLAGIQMLWPQTSAGLRLLAWMPVAIGSSVTLVGSMRYLGVAS